MVGARSNESTHPTEGIGEQVMKATITALGLGLMVGATAVVLPTPQAAAETFLIQQADPNDAARTRERNGILELRPTDEEHTNEQPSCKMDPTNPTRGICVMMSTGQLASTAGPNAGDQIQVGNIQGACMPISLVQDDARESGIAIQGDVANFRYISQRNSEDQRAFHHPEVEALGNGMYAITANWDRNNNTNTDRYLQVVDSNCNLQTLEASGPGVQVRSSGVGLPDNSSVRIMAKNNDNCSGRQAGGGGDIYVDPAGVALLSSAELCNGNGRDDGWNNLLRVQTAGPGTVAQVTKVSDTSFISREERSRGSCALMDTNASGTPDMSFCCGTEGNSQPMRDGVWCAGIDVASGDLLFRERVAYRGETAEGLRTYAMRIKMLPERNVDGSKTGQVLLQYQMHRGNNNSNKKGGYDDKVLLAVAQPSRQGTNVQQISDLTSMVITARTEFTHATMFQTFTGSAEAPTPTFAFLSGNHNANNISAKALNVTLQNGKAFDSGVTSMGAGYDHQKYSKYLGDNPNNQGRNYSQCEVIQNPFTDLPGKTQGVPVINMCAMNAKFTSDSTQPQIKPDFLIEAWTSLQAAAPAPGPAPAPGVELPNVPSPEGSDSIDNGNPNGQTVGGCSVSNGSMGGSAMFVLFGLALALRRRRS